MLLTTLWVFILFDPHWLLNSFGLGIARRIPTLLFGALLLVLVFVVPATPSWSRRWQWQVPYLAYMAVGVVTVPFALNNGLARETLQVLFLLWGVIVATSTLYDSARRAEQLLLLYAVSFLWWGLWGARVGLVRWHPVYANYDGFGAFMVGGMGMCYFMALAAPTRRIRRMLYVTAAISAIGVVASFARGAFLSALVVGFVVWLRSPRKLATAAAGVAGAIVVAIAAAVLFDGGAFWAEIMSSFEEGTEEGTGADRWVLWEAALRVFMERPLLGVGLRNFGVFGAFHFEPGELGGMYANPGALYNHPPHNLYVEILAEGGILGFAAFVWILVDFWKRNATLRSAQAEFRWRRIGGRFSMRPLALGLEASMVAYLVDSLFYTLTSMHWYFSLLAINLLLHTLTTAGVAATRPAAGRGSRRGTDAAGRAVPRLAPPPGGPGLLGIERG